MSKKLSCFGYYGGKFSKLDWLLPQLNTPHQVYCELFAGSLAVMLNKSRAKHEIVNDLSEEVADFWLALREHKDELIHAIALSPPGESEFLRCRNASPSDDVVERARRFYVFIVQVFSSIPMKRGVRTSLNHSLGFCSRQKSLRGVAERLHGVVVENTDACRLMRRVIATTNEPILFYADPPYPFETRYLNKAYLHDDFDHDEFLAAVIDAPPHCKFAISGYNNELYNNALANWHRVEVNTRMLTNHGASKSRVDSHRVEVLWRNYDAVLQPTLL